MTSKDSVQLENPATYKPEVYDVYWNSFLPIFFDRMNTVMRKHMTNVVSDHGLTSAHAVYLVALTLKDGQSLLEISRFLDMDPANTNRVVKVLRDKGLIYDDRRSPKGRNFSIYLTQEGRKLGQRVIDSTTKWMSDCMSVIPREEIIAMRNTLIKILEQIDPDLPTYMGLRYDQPFYTYLHFNPPDRPGLVESALASNEHPVRHTKGAAAKKRTERSAGDF